MKPPQNHSGSHTMHYRRYTPVVTTVGFEALKTALRASEDAA